ncbi:MAG: glutamate ligase domain-containing protein, partial [Rudaea sp.]
LLTAAAHVGAHVLSAGQDFRVLPQLDAWRWEYSSTQLMLPEPGLAAPCQIDNAAAAIMSLYSLRQHLGWDAHAIAHGVRAAHAPARLQRLQRPGAPELVIDVGHNPQAAQVLAQWLAAHPPRGRNLAVFGALADKDAAGIAAPLAMHIAQWHLCGLDAASSRGLSAAQLRERVSSLSGVSHSSVDAALDAVGAQAGTGDRILAFGSFFVAAPALEWARRNRFAPVLGL